MVWVFTVEQSEKGRKEKHKVSIDFEPFKQIGMSFYLCNNPMERFLQHYFQMTFFGFIISDGSGISVGTHSAGISRGILCKSTLALPKQDGRGGGQSTLEFAHFCTMLFKNGRAT